MSRSFDHRTPSPQLNRTPVWASWWENFDEWDGASLYDDIDDALAHTTHSYVSDEYGWHPHDDPAEEAPEVQLTWNQQHPHTAWHLLDGQHDTGVRVFPRNVCTSARTPANRTDEILRIVSDTVIEANNIGGVDLNDLVTRLEQAGFELPGEDE